MREDSQVFTDEAQMGADLGSVSVAERMRWASKRETTRTEDIAYCLLGIFDVNMPLLYGEGEKAFTRLQEEIMKNSDDQTIFAWVPSSAGSSDILNMDDISFQYMQLQGHVPVTKSDELVESNEIDITPTNVRGIFANHPNDFRSPSVLTPRIIALQASLDADVEQPYMLTNKGVEITLIMITLVPTAKISVAVLGCAERNFSDSLIGIIVQADPNKPMQLYRREGYGLVRVWTHDLVNEGKARRVYLSKRPLIQGVI
ncbi:uncharacterized protein N0V89_003584 [Didymosphaeria variabile]|uniref:DUF8212 domain-containing protein n=1 Tax=Didymosphaeria variabile TaxID=1932322 RepID=A0A9W8XQ88_9PLEO|nr:uncharacterized protein N0V89_003584 [Didymosphaeria variabile]KAJ4355566.1 hypothetical protein N0V89_003584 [Didymosphaeria variabile]